MHQLKLDVAKKGSYQNDSCDNVLNANNESFNNRNRPSFKNKSNDMLTTRVSKFLL